MSKPLLSRLQEAGVFQPPSDEDIKKRKVGMKRWKITAPDFYLGEVLARTAAEAKEKAEEGDFDVERMPGGVISAEEMKAEEIKES